MVLESLRRLSTFAKWPMPSDACSGITNFVSKAEAAHFERTADCVDDEVVCESCGVSYKNWTTESPHAVHRTISPKCPALNPSSSDSESPTSSECSSLLTDLSSLQQNPFLKFLPDRLQNQIAVAAQQTEDPRTPERASGTADDQELPADQTPEQQSHSSLTTHQGADGVRRVLFPDADGDHSHENRNPHTGNTASETEGPQNLESHTHSASSEGQPKPPSVLDQVPITHPFRTTSGGYDNFFASNRLKTFPGPTSSLKHQAWAEEGFIYREMEEDLLCVFCGTVMVVNGHQPKVAHAKACPSCPFVIGFDVGNITLQHEKDIRLSYFQQQASKKQLESDLMILKYPHYENEEDRQGSFEQGWPKMHAKLFPPRSMAVAGFFYSGCSDKVMCYSCGIELYDLGEDVVVWETHARVSPTCLHVIQQKGQEFITQAASTEILVKVKYHKNTRHVSVTRNNGVIGEEPGSCNLDMTAVKAALACRYPNEAILKASLKAADENHITICKQQQAIHQVHSELERKEKDVQQSHAVIQQSYTVIQHKDTVIQHKDTEIQHKDTEIQHKDTEIQHKDTEIQHKDTEIQHKDTEIQHKDTEIQHKDTEIQHKDTVIQEQGTQLQRVIQEKEQIAQDKRELHENLSQRDQQLQLKDQQIQTLMQHVESLRADRQHRAFPGPAGDAADPNEQIGNAQEEGNEQRHSLVCKICQSNKPRMIFLPCGHLYCCAECTPRLPDRRCPVCRRDISSVLPAFVA